jgi:penicillin-binding protein 1A
MAQYVIRVAHQAGIAVLFVIAALLGIASGVLFAYSGDLPEISALDDYSPSTITRVYSAKGEVLGEFATQRRTVIAYEDIAPRLREAIIASEDADFNTHFGLSISRIVITAIRDILQQRRAGASTLTQQLARNLFPESIGFDKTLSRKIKEALVSVQIEKRYTKREIFTLYCNQIYLGHGAYGMEAAARLYFDKSAKDVTVEEAAVLAGTIQRPEALSPFVNMRAALSRRNDYVLPRMVEEGFITPAEAEAARQQPIVLRGQLNNERGIAPYFVEEVRKQLEDRYGAKGLYEQGLSVYTTLDVELQRAANRAVDAGLRALDKRRGYRTPSQNVLDDGQTLEAFDHDRWQQPMADGDIVPALVEQVDGASARLRIGRDSATLTPAAYAWTRRSSAARLVRPGDVIEVRLDTLRRDEGTADVTLEQTPLVEGALLAIDNRTGQIVSMVGGYSFARSKFNRATQAQRQLGSLFKAILYTAAVDRGYTPTALIDDDPVSFDVGPDQKPYAPTNYDHTYEGPITMRRALEKSRNVPAVRMMNQLGPEQVIEYARRFGFTSPLQPFLSLALGASEATLLEVTSAYSVFPNQGVRMRPYDLLRVTDRDGNVLEENRPSPIDAIRADTAYVMTNLLRGVVLRGTGIRAASIDWPLAGKTGTVDDYTDGWFVGFDPYITVGVWVGHDEKKPLGSNEDGARSALPIWIDYMRAHVERHGEARPAFASPGNIVFLTVDRTTGKVVTDPGTPGTIREAFIAGTQPGVGFPR